MKRFGKRCCAAHKDPVQPRRSCIGHCGVEARIAPHCWLARRRARHRGNLPIASSSARFSRAFGGRVGTYVSGGAPLGLDTAGWFLDAGIRIQEGYGLTETSPVVSLNTDLPGRMGSVGKPLENVETKLAVDGELLLRGPSVFQGYWNKPDATAESFDAEGWFLTGDVARIDEAGFLYITDRKKDLLKTSGGKMIAPQPIENQLKADGLVGHAAVVGDKRKFASVLISPHFPALEAWAKEKGIAIANRQQLVAHPEVLALYQKVVDRVNATLASFQTLKRLHVVADEWTLDSGELTPSMKLKRPVVEQHYAAEIASFYQEDGSSHR